jgi:hypothetical protein
MALKDRGGRPSSSGADAAAATAEPGQETATGAEQATELADVKVIESKAPTKSTSQGRKVETLMQVSVLEKQQREDPVKAAQDIAEQTAIIRKENIFAPNSKMGWGHLTKLLFSGDRLENAKQVDVQVRREDLAAAQVAIEGFIQIHMLAGNYKMRTSKGTNRLLLGDNDDPELEMIMAYRQMHLGESLLNSEFEKAWNDPKTQGIVDKLKEAMPKNWLQQVDGDVLMIALYRQEQGHSMMEYIMAAKDPATEEGFNVIRIKAREQGSQQSASA